MPTARKQAKRSPVPKKKTIPKKAAKKAPSKHSKAAAPKKAARRALAPSLPSQTYLVY